MRLAAFTTDPSGGNPAGVWLGDALPSEVEMQRIAARVGYSETAFLAPDGEGRYLTRYYSPLAEVSFCGHATIASGVALGGLKGEGSYQLDTRVGVVPVVVSRRNGFTTAALTSVDSRHRSVPTDLLEEVQGAMGLPDESLNVAIPPALAWAGAWHLILAVVDHATLRAMSYDFERLKRLMLAADLTTIQFIWRESHSLFHSRNPFPVGGVVEDPATGAAAAALGGYLRDAGLLATPAHFLIRQGDDMGRPSRIDVSVPAAGGITVIGTAVPIPD